MRCCKVNHTNLRKLRESKHITVTEVSKLLDVSIQFVYALERGEKKISLYTAIKLADLYNISLDELVGRTPPSK